MKPVIRSNNAILSKIFFMQTMYINEAWFFSKLKFADIKFKSIQHLFFTNQCVSQRYCSWKFWQYSKELSDIISALFRNFNGTSFLKKKLPEYLSTEYDLINWSPLEALDLLKECFSKTSLCNSPFGISFVVGKIHVKKIVHCELASVLFSTTKYYYQLDSLLNYHNWLCINQIHHERTQICPLDIALKKIPKKFKKQFDQFEWWGK